MSSRLCGEPGRWAEAQWTDPGWRRGRVHHRPAARHLRGRAVRSADQMGRSVAIGFEGSEIPTSMEGRTNTLWSLYNALDKHADFLMLDTKVTSAADRQDLLKFAGRYLGRTIDDTPSVWTALRETEYDWFPDYGNFEFWLYQNDAVPGGKTVPRGK